MRTPPITNTPDPIPTPVVINDNAAWCWFQDERALVDPERQLLVVGSVAAAEGPGGEARVGNVELTVVDLATGTSQVVVLHAAFQSDDHDTPALWRRRDGRWLAVYSRHKSDDFTFWRLSEPGDPTRWGPEGCFDWAPFTGGRGVTYQNLHELDGRLYCFARAVNDDPCALVSDDEGDSWSYAGKLFTRPKVGYVNAYMRYASTPRRIDLLATDHHPRDYDNSIYHGYLDAEGLHASDGRLVDADALDPVLRATDAPSQVELTRVFTASAAVDGDRLAHGWTLDLRTRDGELAAAMVARNADFEPDPAIVATWHSRDEYVGDLRFVYGRLSSDGAWTVHQLCRAGAGLLPHEQDYTGLFAIDPHDLDHVYASTTIDPRDGSPTEFHEIYEGRTTDRGASWTWTAITQDSTVDNLRPIVVPGDEKRSLVLWFRGTMTASQHYDCEAVLLDRSR